MLSIECLVLSQDYVRLLKSPVNTQICHVELQSMFCEHWLLWKQFNMCDRLLLPIVFVPVIAEQRCVPRNGQADLGLVVG